MKIFHVWAYLGTPDENTARRMDVVRNSWHRRYRNSRYVPMEFTNPTRDSTDIGDPVGCPYILDMLAPALSQARDIDIILLTNADVGFSEGFTEKTIMDASSGGAIYYHRHEIPHIGHPVSHEDCLRYPTYPGADVFAFSAEWWNTQGEKFPDMILGRYGWDSCMKNMMRRHVHWNHHPTPPHHSKGYVWHETHQGAWNETPEMIEGLPGNVHNRKLLVEWIEKYGGDTEDHLYTRNELNYK